MFNEKFSKKLLCTALCLAASPLAMANKINDTLVVTATRTPVTLAETLAPVTVLTAVDIKRQQLSSMSEVLQRVAGAQVVTNGGKGSVSSLLLRGGNAGHILVLVDGVRINGATLGTTSFQHLDVEDIERIEVVSGSRSSLYGSDAISGIAQIFTKKYQGEGGSVSLTSGSNNESEVRARVYAGNDVTQFTLGVAHNEMDGIDRHSNEDFGNDDEDAYRNSSIQADLTHIFSEQWEFSAGYQLNKGQSEYDDIYAYSASLPYNKFRVEKLSAQLKGDVNENYRTRLLVGKSVDWSSNKNDAGCLFSCTDFKTTRVSASWENDIIFSKGNILTLGSDYYEDAVSGSIDYAEDTADALAFFTQYQWSLGDHQFVVGGRSDDHDSFGEELTYSLSYGWHISENLTLTLAKGSAFKAPTFNDLYWPADSYTAGNPDLEPESSVNEELGLRWSGDQVSFRLSVFRNEVDDLIEWQPDMFYFYQPVNVASATLEGVELATEGEWNGWLFNANFTHIDPRNDETDTILINRARNSIQLSVDREFGALSAGLSFRAYSERYTDVANQNTLSGYGLLDARVSYQLTSELTAKLAVNNILDKDYETTMNFNEDGANWRLSLDYQW